MTEHTPGGDRQDQDQVGVAEKIHRNAAEHGADLNNPVALAGFLGSAAAVLAHANTRLSEPDRFTHAQAMLELIDAVTVLTPEFSGGWDAFLAVHSSVINNAVKAGTMTEQAQAVLFDSSARLLRKN
jgi:hypothetical protein